MVIKSNKILFCLLKIKNIVHITLKSQWTRSSTWTEYNGFFGSSLFSNIQAWFPKDEVLPS